MAPKSFNSPELRNKRRAPVDLFNRILRRGEQIASTLLSLESDPRPFSVTLKDSLLVMVSDIRTMLDEVEGLVPGLSAREASRWLGSLQSVRAALSRINEAVDRAVGLAIQGRLDKQFLFLSPLANSANLSEGLRLRRLESRLVELVQDSTNSETVAHPDLLAVSDISVPVEIQKPTEAPASDAAESILQLGAAALREQQEFQDCLDRILAPDELERNEAVVELIRQYQHWLLAAMLRGDSTRDPKLSAVLEVLSHHAELVLLEDYFYSVRRLKLSHLLAVAESYPVSSLFRRVLSVYHTRGEAGAEQAVASFEDPNERETLMRVLLFHPMAEFRPFAAAQLTPVQFWPVASYPHTPVVALDNILRRFDQDDITDDFRRVFFDCTCRRLHELKVEAEVKAARQMLNRFFGFDFFMEDHYFKRLLQLNESVEQHEARLGIENSFFRKSLVAFLKVKDRVGSKKTQLPKSFADIPLAVQRKLARDGHYLCLFIRHPHPKVALETLPYVSSTSRAEQVLRVKNANRQLIAEIAKRDELVTTYRARLALVSHPKTVLKIATKYIPQLRRADLTRLSQSRDINPEIRRYLKRHVIAS